MLSFRTILVKVYHKYTMTAIIVFVCFRTILVKVYLALVKSPVIINKCFRTILVKVYPVVKVGLLNRFIKFSYNTC